MLAKRACVVRVIRGLLTTALVLVLMPLTDVSTADEEKPSWFPITPVVRFGPPDLMMSYHFGKIPVERKPPPFRPHPLYVKLRPLGWTPMPPPPPHPKTLMGAAGRADLGGVKRLLDKGADVNAKDERGWTPLMEAANHGHSEIVKLLLDKGADVNLKHQYGWTALSIAKGKGNKEIEKLLRAHGAKK